METPVIAEPGYQSEVRKGVLDRDVFSAKELAVVLDVHYETIHAWIKNGELHATNGGGPVGYRITRESVLEMLRKREVSRGHSARTSS